MKTMGLIGGMSWESTAEYYKVINQTIKKELGGLHSAKCLMYSVDFQEIEECQSNGNWNKSGEILAEAAIALEKAGADFIVICTNTMHKVIDLVKQSIHIPILHIADVTAQALLEDGIDTIALLGTKYTMEQNFYKQRLIANHINVIIPEENDRTMINNIIYHELCLGQIKPESKQHFLSIIDKMNQKHAKAIILGCTEIGLLIKQSDTDIPLYDTSYIHAHSAAMYALAK
ncbi:MAG: aspartate racemase [Firmicutes bacterium]|nr:aspartate racemase [Bacillota bacterium]